MTAQTMPDADLQKDLRALAMGVLPERRYDHNCPECIYLGQVDLYDIYLHTDYRGEPCIMARCGSACAPFSIRRIRECITRHRQLHLVWRQGLRLAEEQGRA